jgi:hypothetical protein
MSVSSHANLQDLAVHLRAELEQKQFVLLFGYNGVGKTRLSSAFKDLGKSEAGEEDKRDTLYYNAFTEDLFTWENDLKDDRVRSLKMNSESRFFAGLSELEMENRIGPMFSRFAPGLDFRIDYEAWTISFSREVSAGDVSQTVDNIKVSRGEENIFIWCFFLAIVQLVLDRAEAYAWVRYIYIDDPISSLDEHNAIEVAHQLAQLLGSKGVGLPVVVSTHHTLFFNVLCNELQKARRRFLKRGRELGSYALHDTTKRDFFKHLSDLAELNEAQESGDLATYHFNMLRRLMEQAALFHGLSSWKECIGIRDDEALLKRIIDLMSHDDYSLYQPREMMEENKAHFRRVFLQFIRDFPFDRTLFAKEDSEATATP